MIIELLPLLKTPAYVAAIKLAALGAFLFTTGITIGVPLDDPWFCAFVGFWIFSAITSGMPEPEKESSFFYVWAYRTMHILSANGTAFFISKNKWDDISG